MFPIFSSNIKGIDHIPDGDSGTLLVEFNSGDKWAYDGVAEDVYQKFRTAESAGKFYHAEVRGKYASRKIEEE